MPPRHCLPGPLAPPTFGAALLDVVLVSFRFGLPALRDEGILIFSTATNAAAGSLGSAVGSRRLSCREEPHQAR